MKDLLIEPTKNTPYVEFNSSGKLIIAGNIHSNNAVEFFEPLIEWIKNLSASKVDLDLILEYINTPSAKKLFELIKKLKTNNSVKEITINWYYQKGDIDHFETGQIFAEAFNGIKFNFVTYER